MGSTSIEWTDFSVNPIRARNLETGNIGHFCEKISAGCAHCYAATFNVARRHKTQFAGTDLDFLPANREKVEPFLDEKVLKSVLSRRKPTKFFWCDMTDMFGHWVPDEWIDRCFAVMAMTPRHTHQVLTKRPERMARYFKRRSFGELIANIAAENGLLASGTHGWRDDFLALYRLGDYYAGTRSGSSGRYFSELAEPMPTRLPQAWPLPNVWLGTSVENQQAADERIPHLLRCQAAVRFLSVEPLLGAVDLEAVKATAGGFVNWVIVGGESGPHARPMHINWVRSLRDQCEAARVPFFFKQHGEWAEAAQVEGGAAMSAKMQVIHPSGRIYAGREIIPSGQGVSVVHCVGKKAAGRLLDGRAWDEFPEVAHG